MFDNVRRRNRRRGAAASNLELDGAATGNCSKACLLGGSCWQHRGCAPVAAANWLECKAAGNESTTEAQQLTLTCE